MGGKSQAAAVPGDVKHWAHNHADKVPTVSLEWLFDSAGQYEVMPLQKYLLS